MTAGAFGVLLLAAWAGTGAGKGAAPPPSQTLDGRPPVSQASPLQARVDAAPWGSTVVVGPGEYRGDLILDRPIRLVGRGRPRLVASGAGSVVRIRADGAVVEGFDIDGRRAGDVGRDSAGIHIAAHRVTVRDCRITDALFGIYLRAADGAVVQGCTIRGIPGVDPGEKGSGIHVWNTHGYLLANNVIFWSRDGFYIQESSHGRITGNLTRDLRYGLHYMFSDDNDFDGNTFENSAAGAALMYSRRITFRRNRFLHNRGYSSVGLLLKECDDVLAEDNLIADNARGIFLEGSYRNVFRRNVVAESDDGIVLYDSCAGNRFEGNSFVANLSPLFLVGKRTDTVFLGNYWSDNGEPDLDGDGRSDRPFRLSSVFDHLRGNLTAADLMAQGLAASALGVAESTFPVLDVVPVEDPAPLARPPALRAVPRPPRRPGQVDAPALAVSAAVCLLGAVVLARGGLRGRRVRRKRA